MKSREVFSNKTWLFARICCCSCFIKQCQIEFDIFVFSFNLIIIITQAQTPKNYVSISTRQSFFFFFIFFTITFFNTERKFQKVFYDDMTFHPRYGSRFLSSLRIVFVACGFGFEPKICRLVGDTEASRCMRKKTWCPGNIKRKYWETSSPLCL